MEKNSRPKMLWRSFDARDVQVDAENRTISFPFSSEAPVARWFGNEILSHDSGAMNMDRLNDGAPLLFNHDSDAHIGVIDRAWVDNKRGMATVRFGNSALAQEKFQDVQDKILRKVSFGYMVDDMVLSRKGGENDPSDYTVTKFTPFEVSMVTIPADNSVGLGRELETDTKFNEILARANRAFEVSNPPPAPVAQPEKQAGKVPATKGERMPEVENQPDLKVVAADAMKAERERIGAITALGDRFKKPEIARAMIENGKSVDEARAAVLEALGAIQKPIKEGEGNLDLTDREKQEYSLVRAIQASVTGNWKNAGFERECSEAIAKARGKETTGFFMPMNVKLSGTRTAYNVGTAGQGGNLVATNLLAGEFIEILRNKILVKQLGARMLSGLVGNVAIPRRSAATTTYWVAEGSAVTEAEATFDQVTLSPKQVGALSEMSRLMLQQATPDIESLVREDLAAQLALAIDLAAINGSNSGGQPKGVLNQSGIGSVAMGTNGGAVAIAPFIDLETNVATANADFGSLAYLTNPKVVGDMKKLVSTTGQPLWQGAEMGYTSGTPGMFNGYTVGRTNQVPSNLTKGTSSGVCSAAIFGNWADLIIGEWGTLEVLPNPYDSTAYPKGAVRIRAMQTVDIAVRHAASFAAVTDLTTTT